MSSYLLIDNRTPEFAELVATRPTTIPGFYSTGMDCLNKTFFWGYLKFQWNVINRLYIHVVVFPSRPSIPTVLAESPSLPR